MAAVGALNSPEVNLEYLATYFWRQRKTIAFVAIPMFLCLAVIVFCIPSQYTSRTSVIVDPRDQYIVDIKSVLSNGLGDKAGMASEMEVLRSRDLMVKVAEKFGLYRYPEFAADISNDDISNDEGADQTTGEGGCFRGIADKKTIGIPSLTKTVDRALKKLDVVTLNESRVIEVSFTSRCPQLSAAVVNEVANLYTRQQPQLQADLTQFTNVWIGSKIPKLQENIRTAVQAREDFRSRSILANGETPAVIDRQIQEISSKIVTAKADLGERRIKVAAFERTLVQLGPREALELNVTPVSEQLVLNASKNADDLAQLEQNFGGESSALKMPAGKVKASTRRLQDEANVRLSVLRTELSMATERGSALERRMTELADAKGAALRAETELLEHDHSISALQQLLETFEKRKGETEQAELNRPAARIISQADIPTKVSKPNRLILLIGALVFSAFAGFFATFVRDARSRRKFISLDEIGSELGLPTYSVVPLIEAGLAFDSQIEGLPQLATVRTHSVFGAALRGLTSSISLKMTSSTGGNSVLFTSALPGEGKTSLAAATAFSMARPNFKVLLVEADLYRPHIHKITEMDNSIGMSDYLAYDIPEISICRKTRQPGLYVATAGRVMGQSIDMDRIAAFVYNVSPNFDMVIVDSPPLLPNPDARLLAGAVHQTVFVVRWGGPARRAVQHALAQLREVGQSVVGVVLNQADSKKQLALDCTEASYLGEKSYSLYLDG